MHDRTIVMLALLCNDCCYRSDGARVCRPQQLDLLLQVAQYHAFDRNRCGRDSAWAKQPCDKSQCQPADATKPITATTAAPATMKLETKDLPVPYLVRPKLGKLCDKVARRQTSHEYLTGVNADCAVLASVINFDNAAPEIGSAERLRNGHHDA